MLSFDRSKQEDKKAYEVKYLYQILKKVLSKGPTKVNINVKYSILFLSIGFILLSCEYFVNISHVLWQYRFCAELFATYLTLK